MSIRFRGSFSAFNRRLLREKKGIRALCRQITPDADPKVVTAAATAVWQACTSRRNSHLAIEFDIISRLCRQLEVHSDNKNLCVACGGALMQLGRLGGSALCGCLSRPP